MTTQPVRSRRWVLRGAVTMSLAAAASSVGHLPAVAAPRPAVWRTSWAAAQVSPASLLDPVADEGVTDTTVRHIVRMSAGGQPRLRFANTFGTRPLVVGSVTVGRPAQPPPTAAVDPASVMPVTFAGARTLRIPPGASASSDPIPLWAQDGSDLVISFHLPGPTGPLSLRRYGLATGYLSEPGNHAADPHPAAFPDTTTSVLSVTGVDVRGPGPRPSIAALGDSITEGYGLGTDTNERWPDFLARGLARGRRFPAIANLGISANKLLVDSEMFGDSALTRFERDVLGQEGLRTVIVQIGGNDIVMEPHQTDPDTILAGYRELVRRGGERGLRMIGTTVTPMAGWGTGPELESVRQTVNRRIRDGGPFDAVVDFDAALCDPDRPDRLLPAYDSGDGIHPNAAGASAVAAAVPPSLVDG